MTGESWRVVIQSTGVAAAVWFVVAHGWHVTIERTVWNKRTIGMVTGRFELHFCFLCLSLVLHSSVLKPSFHLHVR